MRIFFKKYRMVFLVILLVLSSIFLYQGLFISPRPYLTVIGYAKMADGIGRQAVELMNAVYDDVSLGFVPYHKSNLTDVPERICAVINKPNKKMGRVIIYEPSLPAPHDKPEKRMQKLFKGPKNAKQIRIAYSMLESSRIPPEWAELLNAYFDAVAVPDSFLVEVYKRSGVEIPIFVVPLGLEIDPFLDQPLKTASNKPFRFINASTLLPRKNHEGLIQAFHQAFGNNADVELHINYRYCSQETLVRVKNLIKFLNLHNVFVTDKELSNKDYLDFFLKGDALVTLSKGEGFSIQPREAMALGLPVIISDNTAHKTIINSQLAHAVTCPIAEIAYYVFLKCECGEEYVADVAQAAAVMRYVYENYEDCLKTAQDRRQWAANYRFEYLKPLYLNLIKPTRITLGDHNEVTKEGLITNSPELYAKYQNLTKKI